MAHVSTAFCMSMFVLFSLKLLTKKVKRKTMIIVMSAVVMVNLSAVITVPKFTIKNVMIHH